MFFFCTTEEEVKRCFDKCGFWKTAEERSQFYAQSIKDTKNEESKKRLCCSLYDEESIEKGMKLGKLYDQRLFDCLLYKYII